VEKTISSESIFEGHAVKLRIDTVQKSDGGTTTREIVGHSECIAAVVLDDADNVILVRQFRKAVEKELLEIPAGCIEQGEAPEETLRRELQEEIGFLPRKITRLGGFYSSPGYCTEYLYLFLGEDLTPSQMVAEDTDEIKVVKVPLVKIPGLITSGNICDGKSIAGLLTYLATRKQ